MTQEAKVCKMSDLVRLTGVSKQTIHYYLREGLLLPPVRTSKNMAYYDESTVDDIRFIKELQEKRYLPLAVVKKVLKAKREGQDLGEEDHLILFDHLFSQVRDNGADQQFDKASFLARTGLTERDLNQLINMGIISPSPEGGDCPFDGFDLAVAGALKKLMAMGMKLQDLKLYGRFLQCARTEAELVHDRIIHRDTEEQHPPLKEIQIELEKVKNLLTVKAYREFFVSRGHYDETEEGGN
ncbi:MAG: MerR family transcriptional regulator [Syntrophomonadaceae bacterium]|nr:MerR family transcriptional regulator [Syntrophomonadaceae bacterium]